MSASLPLRRALAASAVLVAALAGPLAAQEVFVDFGSTWRFLRGTAPPSEPDATKWRQLRFCDDDWEPARASIGYGDDDDATVLADMPGNYTSIYVRKVFEVRSIDDIATLMLAVNYDDGFVCYVNDKEAARALAGEPGEELGFDSVATNTHEAGVPEFFDLAHLIGDLVVGENVIAFQVLNGTLDSSDLTFDARLTANEEPPWGPQLYFGLGSEWKFFRGRSPPSDPDPTAWRNPGFADDTWESGATSIGYGDDDDATVLGDMQGNYVTLYARKTFDIPDPRYVSALRLGMDYDDSFVAYLNGVEITRANAGEPGEELGFDSLATTQHEAGVVETFDISAASLVAGDNVLAVEVHNATLDSSDLTFNARLTANERPPGTFTDAGFDLGGSKAAWADFDDDGWSDILAGGAVWRNKMGRGFERVASIGDGIWGDFDNDGRLDIFNYSGRRLYRNEGGGIFRDVTAEMIPGLPMVNTRGAAWADFDGDSYIDLYVGGYESPGYQPDAILMNDEGRSFRLAWVQSGDVDPSRGITAADFDEDGDMDVYVSNYRLEQNQLWRNRGNASFVNAGPSHGVQGTDDGWSYSYGHTIGSAWGDLDDDGHIDLFVGNFSHPPGHQDRSRFYRNLGPAEDHRFADLSGGAGLAWQESFASPSLADMDNDGDLDLFFTTVYSGDHSVLYENLGGFRFTDVTGRAGIPTLVTYQSAWGDFDNDGDLDLTSGGRLFRNDGTASNWVKIRLHGDGVKINRAAIGAQVRASILGRTITRQVESGTGEGNQNDLTLHFGLASHVGAVPIAVTWPDGKVELTEVAAQQTVNLTYGFTECAVFRELPDGFLNQPGQTVSVTLQARNVTGLISVVETFPVGWQVRDAAGGLVAGNSILFDIPADGELTYELEVVPQVEGECEPAVISGSFSGQCVGSVQGPDTMECSLGSDPILLLHEGHETLFLRGFETPPASWRDLDFDDCEWDSGYFGIGYGDDDDATILDDMQDSYTTVYCRVTVDLEDYGLGAGDVESLQLKVRFDDGFVAHLNGDEIVRVNVSGGTVTASTVANQTVGDAPRVCDAHNALLGCAVINIDPSRLQDGENCLAFSVHNGAVASSDLSFIPVLALQPKPEELEPFRRGDANSDGGLDVSDGIRVLSYLFASGQAPECFDAADVNDSGSIDISDALAAFNYLFAGGAEPPAPGPDDCGVDETADELDCAGGPCWDVE